MRVMQKLGMSAAVLAVGGLMIAPASAQGRHHGRVGAAHHAHAYHGGHYRAFRHYGYHRYAGGPYYYGGYGYPYRYGYYDDGYDPGAAMALGMIGTIAGLIAHNEIGRAHV